MANHRVPCQSWPALPGNVSLGFFVPLHAKEDKIDEIKQFLGVGYDLIQEENETIQWYGVQYNDHTPPTFAVVDTFRTEGGRDFHLHGKVADALMANASTLLSSGPEIIRTNVLANKVTEGDKSRTTGLTVGLRALLTAKPDKVQAVKDFLISLLPIVGTESGTRVWYALQFDGTNEFSLWDFFESDVGRHAHINGKAAAAVFASAEELFASPPDVAMFDVVVASIKL
ncbi:hypothetical protein C8J57DRAFT_1290633 [Mycena rebaudengoi]|nr:hypothetical protein C8J57DRAFT_1290633 [Mycena rebaudengoi]